MQTNPCNIEAEKSVIGSILLNNDMLDEVMLALGNDGRKFFHAPHGQLYERMTALHARRQPVDVITLGQGMDIETMMLLSECSGSVKTSAHAGYHAAIVRDQWQLRQLAEGAGNVHALAMQGKDARETLDRAQQIMGELFQNNDTHEPVHVSNIVQLVVSQHRDVAQGICKAPGVMCGVPAVDQIVTGWKPGTLNIVAARTSVGKTAFALQCALYAAEKKVSVLVFSLEMDRETLTQRLMAQVERFDVQRIRQRFQAEPEIARMERAAHKLATLPIHIDDGASLTLYDIRSRARRHIAKHGESLIIVDYLQLLRMDRGTRKRDRFAEVKDISNGLKELSRELKTPVIALAQLSREAEKESNIYRKLACMRESGDIEQDADVVVILSRVDHEADNTLPLVPGRTLVQMGVAKQRNGPTGEDFLLFDPIAQRFEGVNDQADESRCYDWSATQ